MWVEIFALSFKMLGYSTQNAADQIASFKASLLKVKLSKGRKYKRMMARVRGEAHPERIK